MTTSDKIVLIVGTANCVTMAVTGWTGLKVFEAIVSKKEPKPTPEENTETAINRAAGRKLNALCAFLFVGCLVMLFLMWHLHTPITFKSVMEINFASLGMVFAIVIPLLSNMLETLRLHILITKGLHDQLVDHFELMKIMVSEIDKKADSRRKIQPPAN